MDWHLEPTEVQCRQLEKPWTASLAALQSADFLGRQDYIDWWICDWLQRTSSETPLPLCVTESLHCDRALRKRYMAAVRNAIVRGDTAFVRSHYILHDPVFWNYVRFPSVPQDLFACLAQKTEIPRRLCPFIVAAQRLALLETFVHQHGPTLPLRDAICHQWVAGVAWLLRDGAQITEDCVGQAVRHAHIFSLVTDCNPEATQRDWEEFLLQYTLKRVPDVAQVEQWFYIHGFKI